MKTLNQWLTEYAVSHQNKKNQIIHTICVPVIFMCIVIALWNIKWNGIPSFYLAIALVLPFYIRLGLASVVLITIQCLAAIQVQSWFVVPENLWTLNILTFVVAWIGQFIGHSIEGKRPSFVEDLKFLLVGPLWVFMKDRK